MDKNKALNIKWTQGLPNACRVLGVAKVVGPDEALDPDGVFVCLTNYDFSPAIALKKMKGEWRALMLGGMGETKKADKKEQEWFKTAKPGDERTLKWLTHNPSNKPFKVVACTVEEIPDVEYRDYHFSIHTVDER